MSAYEGSKQQERDEDKLLNKGVSRLSEFKTALNEKKVENEKFESFLFKIWSKAKKLEFDDFKGWCKGEGYIVSRVEE